MNKKTLRPLLGLVTGLVLWELQNDIRAVLSRETFWLLYPM